MVDTEKDRKKDKGKTFTVVKGDGEKHAKKDVPADDKKTSENVKDAAPADTDDDDTKPHEDGQYPTFKGKFVDKGRAPVKVPLPARFLLKLVRLAVQACLTAIFVLVVIVMCANVGSAAAVELVNTGAIGSMDIIMVFSAICGGGAAGALYLVPRLWNGMNWVCWSVKGAWRSRKGGR